MKKLRFIIRVFIPVFLLASIVYIIKSTKISEITCKSQYGECSVLINDKLSEIKNCDYFTCIKNTDSELLEVRIVDKYNYQLKLPLRIEVNVIEKKPKFSIINSSENLTVQIDSEGLVLDNRDMSNLPGFLTEKNLPNPGDNLTDREYFALQMVYGTTKIQEIDEARLENDFLSVALKDGKRILFPLEGDRDFILGALTLILSELKKSDTDFEIGNGPISVVDLRFNNPILK